MAFTFASTSLPAFDANRQADSVHADFVSHIARARGVFKLAHVARVCDMFGYLLAIHFYEFEISNLHDATVERVPCAYAGCDSAARGCICLSRETISSSAATV